MDKVRWSEWNGGMPVALDDIVYDQAASRDAIEALVSAFMGLQHPYNDNFVISGCVATETVPGSWDITAGWCVIEGELYKVDAQTGFVSLNDTVLTPSVTNGGTRVFKDGNAHAVQQTRRAVLFDEAGGTILSTQIWVGGANHYTLNSGRSFNPYRKLSTTQRDAIGTWQQGESIYNITTNKVETYDGSAWNGHW